MKHKGNFFSLFGGVLIIALASCSSSTPDPAFCPDGLSSSSRLCKDLKGKTPLPSGKQTYADADVKVHNQTIASPNDKIYFDAPAWKDGFHLTFDKGIGVSDIDVLKIESTIKDSGGSDFQYGFSSRAYDKDGEPITIAATNAGSFTVTLLVFERKPHDQVLPGVDITSLGKITVIGFYNDKAAAGIQNAKYYFILPPVYLTFQ